MNLIAFFKLIRWKNLLLLLYVQLLLKYVLFPSFKNHGQLSILQFAIFTSSLLFITAAGYIINDIFDIESDKINKPRKLIVTKYISVNKAKALYFIINSVGVILGIGLSMNLQQPPFSFIFIASSTLLYYYSKKIKGIALLGNLLVSFLIAFSIYTLGLIDFINIVPTKETLILKNTVLVLSIIAFFINFSREIIKDVEDVKGDYIVNLKTIPILLGTKRSLTIAAYNCLIPIAILSFIIINFSKDFKATCLYLLFFSLIPLLIIFLKLLKSTSKKSIQKLSIALKVIMFFGINSLILFSFKL